MALEWKGDQVVRRMRSAQKFGINKTMADAVNHAKRNHDWNNQTGTLEGSISIAEFAHRSGNGYRGTWGSKDVVYALIHELGGKIVPKRAKRLLIKRKGEVVASASSVTIRPRPYLRPAADAIYPQLAANIRLGLTK